MDLDSTGVPIVDLSKLRNPSSSERSAAIHDLGRACQAMGFFQVVNHGISPDILHGALDAAAAFFNLSAEDKSGLMSEDIRQPVRYSTVSELDCGEVKIRRHVLKQYSRPLETWIDKWPSKPIHFREKMSMFAAQVWRLVSKLVEAITESLGLGHGYLASQMERGFEMMALNCYPPRQDAGAVCFPPHTDYTLLTALVASHGEGLEYMDRESRSWRPATAGSSTTLVVHIGNYLEVLSNGRYRAALHRVVSHRGAAARVSVASLSSFAMEESVEVAEEVVEEGHPPLYRGSTLGEFIEFLSAGSGGRDFMEQSIRIAPDKISLTH